MSTTEIFSESVGCYTINAYRDGSTEFVYSAFGPSRPVRFELPELAMHSGTAPSEVPWGVVIDDGPQRGFWLQTEVESLRVRIGLVFHLVHKVPTRLVVVQNVGSKTVDRVDLELLFRMPSASPYAVVSSADKIGVLKMADEPGSASVVATEPVAVTPTSSLNENVRAIQVNSLVLHKHEHQIDSAEALVIESRGGDLDHHARRTLVDGSPSYRVSAESLHPGASVLVQIPYWCLRTTKDSAGFSGIGYVVQRDDWKGALACLSAPTHLGTGNMLIDTSLGLLSPIEFFEVPAVNEIRAAIDRLARSTAASFVYVVLPESFEDSNVASLHSEVEAVCDLSVMTVPPLPRGELPFKLTGAISQLLGAAAFLPPDPLDHLIVVPGEPCAGALLAALTPGSVLYPGDDPGEIAVLLEMAKWRRVTFLSDRAALHSSLERLLGGVGRNLSGVDVLVCSDDQEAVRQLRIDDGLHLAARRCVTNAVLALFVVNDTRLIDAVREQMVGSLRLAGSPVPEDLADRRGEFRLLFEFASRIPDAAVGGTSYAAAGPTSLVVATIDGARWHDAVVGGIFARAKKLPVVFFALDQAVQRTMTESMKQLDRFVTERRYEEALSVVAGIGTSWLPDGVLETILRVARRSITVFSPNASIPWELASWAMGDSKRIWLGRRYDIGRMTTVAGVQTASVVYRSLVEAQSPMFAGDRLLFAWDDEVDEIVGDAFVAEMEKALKLGFEVDGLLPIHRREQLSQSRAFESGLSFQGRLEKEALIRLLVAETYSVVNLAAHGMNSGNNQSSLSIGGGILVGSEIPNLLGNPLVLLNSCWGASSDFDEAMTLNSGIAVELISKGAFQVVAATRPISGLVAAEMTGATLGYGFTRSLARVCRRIRAGGGATKTRLEHLWLVTYGDPTVSKFFEFDGLWEIEDTIDKVMLMVPDLSDVEDLKARRRVLEMHRRHCLGALALCRRWAESAMRSMVAHQEVFGAAAAAILRDSEGELAARLREVEGVTGRLAQLSGDA